MNKIELLRLNMLKYHNDDDVMLFDELVQAARCALADLIGSMQAQEQGDYNAHDWDAHQQSIDELSDALGEEQ
jgi:hypothetical protein